MIARGTHYRRKCQGYHSGRTVALPMTTPAAESPLSPPWAHDMEKKNGSPLIATAFPPRARKADIAEIGFHAEIAEIAFTAMHLPTDYNSPRLLA